VLPRSKYNSIIDCIEAAYSRGELVNAGGISISPETGDFITASKTNEIMDFIFQEKLVKFGLIIRHSLEQ